MNYKNIIRMNLIYFINILDGNASNKNIEKFKYLLTKEKEIVKDDSVKQAIDKYIFIGSMYEFSKNNTLIKLLRNPNEPVPK